MADAKLSALTGTSVPDILDILYSVDVSDTTDGAGGSSRSLTLERLIGLAGVQPGGRLTTETGVAVSTSDRTSQSTIYYTPHVSDYVRLYDGTRVKEYVFTERSLALSGLTSGKPYDVFLYDNSGTLTLELLVWTDDSNRATALVWQSGLGWVKTGAATRLHVGTIYATGTGTTEDSEANRYVANVYNRVLRSAYCNPTYSNNNSANTVTTTSTTWVRVNGGTGDLVSFVLAFPSFVQAMIGARIVNSSTNDTYTAVGVDSTSVASRFCGGYAGPAGYVQQQRGPHTIPLAAGRHFLQMLWANAGGTSTYYADAGRVAGSGTDDPLSGLFVTLEL